MAYQLRDPTSHVSDRSLGLSTHSAIQRPAIVARGDLTEFTFSILKYCKVQLLQ